jgi:hypothetical protein
MYDIPYVSDLTKGKNKELNWIEIELITEQAKKVILHDDTSRKTVLLCFLPIEDSYMRSDVLRAVVI